MPRLRDAADAASRRQTSRLDSPWRLANPAPREKGHGRAVIRANPRADPRQSARMLSSGLPAPAPVIALPLWVFWLVVVGLLGLGAALVAQSLRARRSLQRERLANRLIDHSPQLVCVLDPDGAMRHMNGTGRQWLRVTHPDIAGRRLDQGRLAGHRRAAGRGAAGRRRPGGDRRGAHPRTHHQAGGRHAPDARTRHPCDPARPRRPPQSPGGRPRRDRAQVRGGQALPGRRRVRAGARGLRHRRPRRPRGHGQPGLLRHQRLRGRRAAGPAGGRAGLRHRPARRAPPGARRAAVLRPLAGRGAHLHARTAASTRAGPPSPSSATPAAPSRTTSASSTTSRSSARWSATWCAWRTSTPSPTCPTAACWPTASDSSPACRAATIGRSR